LTPSETDENHIRNRKGILLRLRKMAECRIEKKNARHGPVAASRRKDLVLLRKSGKKVSPVAEESSAPALKNAFFRKKKTVQGLAWR